MYISKQRKYPNKRIEQGGRSFMSKYEGRIAQELELRQKAGEFTGIDYQYRIKLYVYLPNGEKAYLFDYLCDFRCHRPNNTFLLVEAKGHATELYRTKKKILDLVWLPDHLDHQFEEIKQGGWRV